MPGYKYSNTKEPIYSHVKNSIKSKSSGRLFEDLKSRESKERSDYKKFLTAKNSKNKSYFPSVFDSLKLLGSPDDEDYLDTFMSAPKQQRRMSVCDERELMRQQPHDRIKSQGTLFSKGKSSKTTVPSSGSSNTSLAMLSSLRSSTSEDSLYESVEMIHYLKTKKILDRQIKTRSIQKTGHSLFDHLREQQALKVPISTLQKRRSSEHERPQRIQPNRSCEFYQTSNGSSPTHSSSSSGDEYETFSRNHSRQTAKYVHRNPDDNEKRHSPKVRHVPSVVGSESDDDWAIPRPLFMKQLAAEKKNKQPKVAIFTCGSDESDSSTKSNGLR